MDCECHFSPFAHYPRLTLRSEMPLIVPQNVIPLYLISVFVTAFGPIHIDYAIQSFAQLLRVVLWRPEIEWKSTSESAPVIVSRGTGANAHTDLPRQIDKALASRFCKRESLCDSSQPG